MAGDLIITASTIITMDPATPRATAVAAGQRRRHDRGGRFRGAVSGGGAGGHRTRSRRHRADAGVHRGAQPPVPVRRGDPGAGVLDRALRRISRVGRRGSAVPQAAGRTAGRGNPGVQRVGPDAAAGRGAGQHRAGRIFPGPAGRRLRQFRPRGLFQQRRDRVPGLAGWGATGPGGRQFRPQRGRHLQRPGLRDRGADGRRGAVDGLRDRPSAVLRGPVVRVDGQGRHHRHHRHDLQHALSRRLRGAGVGPGLPAADLAVPHVDRGRRRTSRCPARCPTP